MNWKQVVPMWVGIIVLVLMGLFPPWTAKDTWIERGLSGLREGNQQGIRQLIDERDHHFILDGPEFCKINATQLIIQWCVVGFLTYGLVKTFESKTAYTRRREKE